MFGLVQAVATKIGICILTTSKIRQRKGIRVLQDRADRSVVNTQAYINKIEFFLAS